MFEEYVTPGDFRPWSCALGTSEDREGVVNFTVTQDPRLLGAHSTGGDGEPGQALLSCSGKPTLLQFGFFDGSDRSPGVRSLRPRKELFDGFADAVRRSPQC
ncbi:hypothetical protein [Streptomyces sp. NPDC058240]|uniref:hypothetical protein n=1 Tax=Streptomyces sp. NPDC058240 TaxID=3346396 RepID=UPI0036E4CCB7